MGRFFVLELLGATDCSQSTSTSQWLDLSLYPCVGHVDSHTSLAHSQAQPASKLREAAGLPHVAESGSTNLKKNPKPSIRSWRPSASLNGSSKIARPPYGPATYATLLAARRTKPQHGPARESRRMSPTTSTSMHTSTTCTSHLRTLRGTPSFRYPAATSACAIRSEAHTTHVSSSRRTRFARWQRSSGAWGARR